MAVPMCIVDVVRHVDANDVPAYKKMLHRLSQISGTIAFEGTKREVTWPDELSPYSGKKTKRLCAAPSDVSLDDGIVAAKTGTM